MYFKDTIVGICTVVCAVILSCEIFVQKYFLWVSLVSLLQLVSSLEEEFRQTNQQGLFLVKQIILFFFVVVNNTDILF